MAEWTLPRTLLGLLRRGAPVIETGECGMKGARGTVVVREPRGDDDGLRVWWETIIPGMVTSVTHGTALDLADPAGVDTAARWFVGRLLDESWGPVEGVSCHMSSRGYLEVHVWTPKLAGRALEIIVGNRNSTLLPTTFESFDDFNRTRGWRSFTVLTPREPSCIAEALMLGCLEIPRG